MNLRNYIRLVNPIHTITRTGKGLHDAPTGKYALSKDPKTNMALWNAIVTAAVALPTAYLINNISNKKAERELEESVDDNQVSLQQALRPDASLDDDLQDLSAQTVIPRRELEALRKLEARLEDGSGLTKSASGDFFASLQEGVSGWIKRVLGEGIKNAIPIGAFTAAAAAGISLSNKRNKDRIKNKLKDKAIQTANLQSKIDRQLMQEMGLVRQGIDPQILGVEKTAAEGEGDDSKPVEYDKIRRSVTSKNNLGSVGLIDWPVLLQLLIGGGVAIGAYKLLSNRDKNVAKLKYLKDAKLGSNMLIESPKLGLSDLPVGANEILITPGDPKQETLADDPEAAKIAAAIKQRRALTSQVPANMDIIDVKPIDNTGIIQEVKKKDALF